MATDRFDLPPASDGREQFAMIERRPDRAQMKAMERHTRQALRGDQAMDAEDWMLVTLCTEWTVYDRDGNPVPLRTGAALDKVPADVLQPLIDELNGVVSAVNRGGAMQQITAALRNMAWSLEEDKAARLNDLVAEIHGLFGVTPPNGTSQA